MEELIGRLDGEFLERDETSEIGPLLAYLCWALYAYRQAERKLYFSASPHVVLLLSKEKLSIRSICPVGGL